MKSEESGFEYAEQIQIHKKKPSSKREAMEHQRHLLAKRAIFAKRIFKRTCENLILNDELYDFNMQIYDAILIDEQIITEITV